MKIIRYTLNPRTLPTATDADPDVQRGELSNRPTGARLLPPCAPSKIVCVGRNYADHAAEFNHPAPPEPLIFLKPPSSLIGSGDAIVLPKGSERVDYEGELGVVIGKRARHVKAPDAPSFILGYTCVNDVSARDFQRKDVQWTRGKGFDTFCAVGPCIIPRQEVDFDNLRVRAFLNGEKKQDASVKQMLFDVNAIIEYVSAFMTLEPGDLIATGTPSGVGPLQPGSNIRIEIEGIGVLENTAIAEG
jgi:2-keto-4-pentenoate hydratase/2-oxohepta-3-ene-1,7-dioic acid hydratase in catechol pathway